MNQDTAGRSYFTVWSFNFIESHMSPYESIKNKYNKTLYDKRHTDIYSNFYDKTFTITLCLD